MPMPTWLKRTWVIIMELAALNERYNVEQERAVCWSEAISVREDIIACWISIGSISIRDLVVAIFRSIWRNGAGNSGLRIVT